LCRGASSTFASVWVIPERLGTSDGDERAVTHSRARGSASCTRDAFSAWGGRYDPACSTGLRFSSWQSFCRCSRCRRPQDAVLPEPPREPPHAGGFFMRGGYDFRREKANCEGVTRCRLDDRWMLSSAGRNRGRCKSQDAYCWRHGHANGLEASVLHRRRNSPRGKGDHRRKRRGAFSRPWRVAIRRRPRIKRRGIQYTRARGNNDCRPHDPSFIAGFWHAIKLTRTLD